ncbi:MAG: hypothetical protein L0191_17790, partial [Acidobacteria bacterium]|nr:hypothetical protein [Acidobacteriota bacterium]
MDEIGGRIIFAWSRPQLGLTQGSFTEFLVLDEEAFDKGKPFVRPIAVAPQPGEPVGMHYFVQAGRGKLLILFESLTTFGESALLPVNINFLAQWDLESGRQDWTYPLQACARAPIHAEKGFARNGYMELFRNRAGNAIYL